MSSNQSTAIRYTVIVSNGVRYIGDVTNIVAPEIVGECGHEHRTEEAAERCQQKLLNWSKDGRTCSAYWYNSGILMHAPGSRRYLGAENA